MKFPTVMLDLNKAAGEALVLLRDGGSRSADVDEFLDLNKAAGEALALLRVGGVRCAESAEAALRRLQWFDLPPAGMALVIDVLRAHPEHSNVQELG